MWGDRLNLDWRLDATNVLNRVTYAAVNTYRRQPAIRFADGREPDAQSASEPAGEVLMTALHQRTKDTKDTKAVSSVLLSVLCVLGVLCVQRSACDAATDVSERRAADRADGQRQGQGRQRRRRPHRQGLHRHRGRRAADDQLRRVPAAARSAGRARAPPTPAPPLPPPRSAAPSPTQGQIAIPPPGDTRYRDRRLLVLYFDLTAMPPADQMRAYAAAQTFIDTQMKPADLVAIMTFGGGARPRQAGLHRRPRRAPRGHPDADLRRRQGWRRHPRQHRHRHRLRPGRCGVQHLQHRPPAVGAADGGRRCCGRCPSRSR